ncbi:MAG: hypothetical protein E7457_05105 [Ruminococcaceae bacterium]|nr:hypothetical protein [Oscillospiraceae bacterium]
MDDEKREIRFPLPNEDGTDTEFSPAAMEEARAKMKSNLEHRVGGIAQSVSIAHELAEAIRPALENFARMAQEVSAAMRPIVEAVQQATASFAKAIADFQIPTITEERKQELIASYKNGVNAGGHSAQMLRLIALMNSQQALKRQTLQ